MPRHARHFIDGLPYHVLNRGNRRQRVFAQHSDYEVFLTTLADAVARWPVRLLAFAIMPNHFHLVIWPAQGIAISAFMRWMMNAHIRRHYRFGELRGTGHLYQGRYKAFPIQSDSHLLTVLRYVEANPLRAQLVQRAEHWAWSSLTRDAALDGRRLVDPSPVQKPSNWREIVNETMTTVDRDALRQSVQRQVPFGDPEWIRRVDSGTVTRDSHE
jgi:putative transposase